MEKFSQRLSQKRKAKRLRQHQLAEDLDVSLGAVSQWEQGKTRPCTNHLLALADLLDVSLDWLLLGKESAKEPQQSSYRSNNSQPPSANKQLDEQQEKLLEAHASLPKDWQNKAVDTIRILAERYGEKK